MKQNMSQPIKKTITLLAIATSVSFLAACGGEADSASKSAEKASTTSIDSLAFAKAKGKVVYNKTCLVCHGENGVGVENLGKNWVVSDFIRNSSDEELLAFIRAGRTIDDPASSGIAPMPPSGGNPKLSDEDLNNVIVYMRSLQD